MVDTHELALRAAEAADAKKAIDIKILDLRGLTSITDYFIVCSGTSTTHVGAITDGVERTLKADGQHPSHIEGAGESTWVLLDYGDVVVHVFEEQTRAFYALERLWGDAPRETVRSASLQGSRS
jgi:ribosome-associated protein